MYLFRMGYSDILDEYGIRLNVIGRVELFPKSVQRAIWQAETKTRHNNRYVWHCAPCVYI